MTMKFDVGERIVVLQGLYFENVAAKAGGKLFKVFFSYEIRLVTANSSMY